MYSLESANIALSISVVSLLLILALFICRTLNMFKEDKFYYKDVEYVKYIDDRLVDYDDVKGMGKSDKQIFYNLVLDEVCKGEKELKIEYGDIEEVQEITEDFLFCTINRYYKEKYSIKDEDDIYYYCSDKYSNSVCDFKIVKMNTYQLELLFRRYKRFGLIDLEVFKTDEHMPMYYKLEEFELKLEDIH